LAFGIFDKLHQNKWRRKEMARKIFLWLLSLGIASLVVFLIGSGILAIWSEPVTGYWQATYCDVQNCPKGSRTLVQHGTFSGNDPQECYYLSRQYGGTIKYDYFLKEGSCKIGQTSFDPEGDTTVSNLLLIMLVLVTFMVTGGVHGVVVWKAGTV
jgi:hypothetical protein